MKDQSSAQAVLVVEDEWLIRAEIAEGFRRNGWRVENAASVEQCVALAEKGEAFDAVVTDINLGNGGNGLDVAEIFRRLDPEIVVVYASGNISPPNRMVPGSAFISKPCEPSKIVDTCRRLSRLGRDARDEGDLRPAG